MEIYKLYSQYKLLMLMEDYILHICYIDSKHFSTNSTLLEIIDTVLILGQIQYPMHQVNCTLIPKLTCFEMIGRLSN